MKYRFIVPLLFLVLLFTGCDEANVDPKYTSTETDASEASSSQTEADVDQQYTSTETGTSEVFSSQTENDDKYNKMQKNDVVASSLREEYIVTNAKQTKERERVHSSEERVEEKEETTSNDLITKEENPRNWYIRLTAEDSKQNLISGSTQLGQMEEDAVSKHTLKAMGSGSLDILFVDPKGVAKGKYKTNYHQFIEDNDDEWIFIVKSNDVNADILLSWNGVYILEPYIDTEGRRRYKEYRSQGNRLVKNMILVDMSTGDEVAMIVDGKAQTYTFNMGGEKERTFRWKMSTEKVSVLISNTKSSTKEAK